MVRVEGTEYGKEVFIGLHIRLRLNIGILPIEKRSNNRASYVRFESRNRYLATGTLTEVQICFSVPR